MPERRPNGLTLKVFFAGINKLGNQLNKKNIPNFFTGNKPKSHNSSAQEDDEKFMNIMMFDEVTWDNFMWKMETSKAMAILGTTFLKKDHFVTCIRYVVRAPL